MSTHASVQNPAQESDHFIYSDQPSSPDAITPHPMLDDGDAYAYAYANNNATTELSSEVTLHQAFITAFDKVQIDAKAPVNDVQNFLPAASVSQVLGTKTQMQPPVAYIDAEFDVHITCEKVDWVEPLMNNCLTIPAEVHCSHIFAMEDRRGTTPHIEIFLF